MADEEDTGAKYTFQTENGETKSMSRGYTGKAVASYPNGDVYDGDFADGIREGRGTYRYGKNGDIYYGEWFENLKHGIGKMIYNMAGPPKDDEEKSPPRLLASIRATGRTDVAMERVFSLTRTAMCTQVGGDLAKKRALALTQAKPPVCK